MTSITEILSEWYASTDEVNRMARDMLRGGMFDPRGTLGGGTGQDTAHNLLDFMERPNHFNREHAWWVANEWPDTYDAWERGRDMGWAVPGTYESAEVTKRLEYLRGEIEDESISMGEIIELQGLVDYIDPSDVVLLEWAGVPE